jgi:hypothetical protein
MYNEMLYDYRSCHVFPVRHAQQMSYQRHTSETAALSGSCKKTPTAIQVSVSKVYVTFDVELHLFSR